MTYIAQGWNTLGSAEVIFHYIQKYNNYVFSSQPITHFDGKAQQHKFGLIP